MRNAVASAAIFLFFFNATDRIEHNPSHFFFWVIFFMLLCVCLSVHPLRCLFVRRRWRKTASFIIAGVLRLRVVSAIWRMVLHSSSSLVRWFSLAENQFRTSNIFLSFNISLSFSALPLSVLPSILQSSSRCFNFSGILFAVVSIEWVTAIDWDFDLDCSQHFLQQSSFFKIWINLVISS